MTRFDAATPPGVYWAIALSLVAMGLLVLWGVAVLARKLTRARLALRESQARLAKQGAELEQTRTQLHEHGQKLAWHTDQLAEARLTLARSNQERSEFLAGMSQDLRTPLNTTLILSKMLADNRQDNLTPEQVKFARSIYSAGNDLLELTSDMLDLSTIEAGKVDLHPTSIALGGLVEELEQTFRPMAAARRIGFTLDVAADLPPDFESDPQRVRQILRTLLSNAVKSTDRGSVSLQVRPRGADIEFLVRDTGAGAGLGLSISRERASLLGGRLDLQSAPGQGNTSSLLLPKDLHTDLTVEEDSSQRGSAIPFLSSNSIREAGPGSPG